VHVQDFLKAEDDSKFSNDLFWQFSGSPFKAKNYQPDLNGDHILLWQRHDAILQSADDKINSGQKTILVRRDKLLPDQTVVKIILEPVLD